ncbi:uncharacterized protein LOC129590207 [Paramacrobiotus metropolitanus]|uniref:uncharacterized protein LOC129590207 n=1 Tax=Paramacrobiotus metropolitanus TaxID=2943436 RepID=UPI0024461CCD|nr:uncharacterized protein LOC129590207 [Paramacrobiotus metropolitanus]
MEKRKNQNDEPTKSETRSADTDVGNKKARCSPDKNFEDVEPDGSRKMDEQSSEEGSSATDSGNEVSDRSEDYGDLDYEGCFYGSFQSAYEEECPSQVSIPRWLQFPPYSSDMVTGKWKMTFSSDIVDFRWQEVKQLFRERKLPPAVTKVVVATLGAYSEEHNAHYMLFCCAPASREAAINIAVNLVRVFPPSEDVIFYKDDNAAPGTSQWHFSCESEYRVNLSLNSGMNGVTSKIPVDHILPRENTKTKWMSIAVNSNCYGGGKWMYHFDEEEIDEKWIRIKELVAAGGLTGVKKVVVSTRRSIVEGNFTEYVLLFICGPAEEEDTVTAVGKQLLRVLPPRSCDGGIYYKSTEQSERGNQKSGQDVNHLYFLRSTEGFEQNLKTE